MQAARNIFAATASIVGHRSLAEREAITDHLAGVEQGCCMGVMCLLFYLAGISHIGQS